MQRKRRKTRQYHKDSEGGENEVVMKLFCNLICRETRRNIGTQKDREVGKRKNVNLTFRHVPKRSNNIKYIQI